MNKYTCKYLDSTFYALWLHITSKNVLYSIS